MSPRIFIYGLTLYSELSRTLSKTTTFSTHALTRTKLNKVCSMTLSSDALLKSKYQSSARHLSKSSSRNILRSFQMFSNLSLISSNPLQNLKLRKLKKFISPKKGISTWPSSAMHQILTKVHLGKGLSKVGCLKSAHVISKKASQDPKKGHQGPQNNLYWPSLAPTNSK